MSAPAVPADNYLRVRGFSQHVLKNASDIAQVLRSQVFRYVSFASPCARRVEPDSGVSARRKSSCKRCQVRIVFRIKIARAQYRQLLGSLQWPVNDRGQHAPGAIWMAICSTGFTRNLCVLLAMIRLSCRRGYIGGAEVVLAEELRWLAGLPEAILDRHEFDRHRRFA